MKIDFTFDDDASEDDSERLRLFLLSFWNSVLPIPLHRVVHHHHGTVFDWNIESIFFVVVGLELVIAATSERY